MPEIYVSVGGQGVDSLQPGETIYLRPIGGGAWPAPQTPDYQPLTLDKMSDGTAVTVMLVEADASEAVIWTNPEGDYYFDPANPTNGLGGQRPGITLVANVDGSITTVRNDAPKEVFKAMFTIAGGENVPPPASY